MMNDHRSDPTGNRPFAPSLVSNFQFPKEPLPGAGTALKSFSLLRQHQLFRRLLDFRAIPRHVLAGQPVGAGVYRQDLRACRRRHRRCDSDATITLTNTATSGVRTTVSTNSGDYTFASVPIGTYVLKAEHQGFKTASSLDLQLQVAQSMTQNFTLQIGGVEQTVTVSTSSDLLQTENTQPRHHHS